MVREPAIMMLRCDMVEATASTQIRKKLTPEVIDAYCEDLKNGAIFPAIDVFKEKGSSRYILADGFHRLIGCIHAEHEEIECNVHEGGMRECLEFALGANSEHGLRRSSADKRHAVEMALKDPEISQFQRQEIADICRVTVRTVLRISNLLFVDDDQNRTLSDLDQNGPHAEPQKPNDGDHRPTKQPLTQAQIERDELRGACKVFAAFPYDGAEVGKLELDKDDIAKLEYTSTWTASAVIALRNGT